MMSEREKDHREDKRGPLGGEQVSELTLRICLQLRRHPTLRVAKVHDLDARRLLVFPHVEKHMQEMVDLRIVNQSNSITDQVQRVREPRKGRGSATEQLTSSVLTRIHTGCLFSLAITPTSAATHILLRAGYWSYAQYTARSRCTWFCVAANTASTPMR